MLMPGRVKAVFLVCSPACLALIKVTGTETTGLTYNGFLGIAIAGRRKAFMVQENRAGHPRLNRITRAQALKQVFKRWRRFRAKRLQHILHVFWANTPAFPGRQVERRRH